MLLYKMKNLMYFQTSTYRESLPRHPKSKSALRWLMVIQAYKSHSPPLAVKLDLEYVKLLAKSTMITPLLTASMADTGAQVIILEHNHLACTGQRQL